MLWLAVTAAPVGTGQPASKSINTASKNPAPVHHATGLNIIISVTHSCLDVVQNRDDETEQNTAAQTTHGDDRVHVRLARTVGRCNPR
jgi:hypothetical protein